MLRLAVPEDLCGSRELPFDLILLGTGQSGHFGDVPFSRNAVSKDSLAFVQRANRESSAQCQKLGLGSIRCVPYFHLISRVTSQARCSGGDCRTGRDIKARRIGELATVHD